MKDRLAKYPGRYTAIVDTEKIEKGIPFNIKITRDDEPTVEGTPYNKESVLPDSVAEAICPDAENPTPADAFMALHNGKAPAGFGLGEKTSPPTAWHLGGESGFRRSSGGSPDGKLWWGITSARDNGVGAQIAFFNKSNSLIEARRIYTTSSNGYSLSGTWEYVNPPMALDTGYRTTERFYGKPVYVKMVDFGVLPATGYTERLIEYNIDKIVRLDGCVYYSKDSNHSWKFPITAFNLFSEVALYGNSSLRFTVSYDSSMYSAYAVLYYTKL